MNRDKSRFLYGAVLALVLLSPSARANGRFPQASLIVFQPGVPAHFLVRTTFGLLESQDAGKTFDWTCESALGLGDQEDPMLAVTEAGVRVAATHGGIVTSAEGCNWSANTALIGASMVDLTLDASTSGRVVALDVEAQSDGSFASQLLASNDNGANFSVLGGTLPDGLFALSVDVAPSDSKRVYVTARRGLTDGYVSVLLRSQDGGLSFEAQAIPNTGSQQLAYLAAVNPTDPDRLYVRVNDASGTALWSSGDGGETLKPLLIGQGKLLGFAVSPDGQKIALGGPADGIWVGAADGSALEQRSTFGPTCLGWSADGIYACGSAATEFAVGRSLDEAATFESLLNLKTFCGGSRCARQTQVGLRCAASAAVLPTQIGATCEASGGAGPGGAGADAGQSSTQSTAGCALSAKPRHTATLLLPLLTLGAVCRRRGRQGRAR